MARARRNRGFTAIETVLAVAILSGVGLVIGDVFTRANRMAENSRQSERAAALGTMALEQYNAYAARRYEKLPSYNCSRATPQVFFQSKDDLGYGGLLLTTQAEPDDEAGLTCVSVRVSWGGGLFPPSLSFSKVYPARMSSDPSDASE